MKKLLITLIGLAIASSTWANPFSAANCTYEITSIAREGFFQMIHIKGWLINIGNAPVTYVGVNAAGYNSQRDMIDHGYAFPVGNIALKPGEKAFFELLLQDKDGNEITQYEVILN